MMHCSPAWGRHRLAQRVSWRLFPVCSIEVGMGMGVGVDGWHTGWVFFFPLCVVLSAAASWYIKQKWDRTGKPREEGAGDGLGEHGGHGVGVGAGAGAGASARRCWTWPVARAAETLTRSSDTRPERS